MNILDAYIKEKPSSQNVIDIFQGEWSTILDGFNLKAEPGLFDLFHDIRVEWANTEFDFRNKKILELGPLEGAHTYVMLKKHQASEVIAIESNTKAFLKCLCIKEIFDLKNAKYHLGDFHEYLKETTEKFDTVFASGVLYHSLTPVELIKLISKVTDKVFLWTHYYDKAIMKARQDIKNKFSKPKKYKYEKEKYTYVEYYYKEALDWDGFCGGSSPSSIWLSKKSLFNALQKYGFKNIKADMDSKDHPNGPSLIIGATK